MDAPSSAGQTPQQSPPPYGAHRPRQLRRRPDEGHLGGVCAGVAEYFDVDPVLIRIAAVVLLISGPGLIAYILGWIFIPEADPRTVAASPTEPARGRDRGMQIFGIVLLVLAVSVLWADWWSPGRRWMFPLGLIALGAWLLLRRSPRGDDPATPDGVERPGQPGAGYGAAAWQGPSGSAAGVPSATVRAPDAPATPGPVVPEGEAEPDAGAADEATPIGGGRDVDASVAPVAGEREPADTDAPGWAAGSDPADTTLIGEAGHESDATRVGASPWTAASAAAAGAGGGDTPGRPGPFPWGGPPPGPSAEQLAARRRRRMLAPMVMGGLLVWAGLAWLLGVSVESALAVGLCIVGVGFVLGAFVGGSWALIVPAALIGGALITATVVDIPLSGPIGQRTWSPERAEDVPDRYELSIGEGTLDLTALDVGRGDTLAIEATVGIGHLIIEVPDDVAVDVEADVGAGETMLFGRRSSGVGVSDRRTIEQAGAGTIDLDLRAGIGQIEVHRIPADPDGTTTTTRP